MKLAIISIKIWIITIHKIWIITIQTIGLKDLNPLIKRISLKTIMKIKIKNKNSQIN
jgi:hypothetical protein